jgi:hypothetical protein
LVTLTAGDANCANGGTRITSSSGTVYVCNGSNGTGGGSGGSLGYGAGEVSIGSCTDTATVGVRPRFTGSDFVFDSFSISGLTSNCVGKTFNFYFGVSTNTSIALKNTTGDYTHSDKIKCTLAWPGTAATKIPAQSSWGSSPQLAIDSSNSTCSTIRTPGTTFRLDKISTADYTNAIGFEILTS